MNFILPYMKNEDQAFFPKEIFINKYVNQSFLSRKLKRSFSFLVICFVDQLTKFTKDLENVFKMNYLFFQFQKFILTSKKPCCKLYNGAIAQR